MDTDGLQFANPIDNLTYMYDSNNKNLLLKVTDATNNSQGFKDGTNIAEEYKYDANGNMTIDNNKGITQIKYNHLNLPTEIFFGSNKISYLYNAVGQKVRKSVDEIVNNQVLDNVTYYLSSFQYHNDILKHFPHAEGYVNASITRGGYRFNYVFNYTDHLGNIRLSYSDANKNNVITTNEVLEENHYYPFGLKHSGYNSDRLVLQISTEFSISNNWQLEEVVTKPFRPTSFNLSSNYDYKYNRKEYQDELGLNMYDYGARNYDAAIGRWMNVDPLAEKFTNISSFAYTANNPILYIDPDGKDIYLFYATKGNSSKEDDDMFWQAALTKAKDFLSSDSYSGNDILRIAKVDDLASIENDAESFIAKNSEKYGKTKEFGVWSHAGTDGPVGTVETSKNKLSIFDNKQMSLKGWGSIDFNWAKNAKAYFYGCNTGVDPNGEKQAFNTEISLLGNFKNVSVYGQTTFSYPSMYSNSRRPSSNQLNGVFGKKGEPTYLVGGNRFTQPWIGWFGDTHFEAHKMSVSKNGKALNSEYQTGKTTK